MTRRDGFWVLVLMPVALAALTALGFCFLSDVLLKDPTPEARMIFFGTTFLTCVPFGLILSIALPFTPHGRHLWKQGRTNTNVVQEKPDGG